MGFSHDGGYGRYMLVRETNFFPVPEDVSAVEATLLLDVMGTSSHAIRRAQLVHPDIRSVYIAGAGPIGVGVLLMAKLLLGDDIPVYISDISGWRQDYAQSLGALPVDAADAAAAAVSVDLAVDSTGRAAARRAAINTLDKRGVLVCVGHGETLTLDVTAELIGPERAVLGSEYFQFNEMPDNLALLREHRHRLIKVITHTFPVEHIADAFTTFLAGRTGKVVVTQEPAR
jgi:threonine dehydrogenase-like Zn-dependent dehydrogenase